MWRVFFGCWSLPLLLDGGIATGYNINHPSAGWSGDYSEVEHSPGYNTTSGSVIDWPINEVEVLHHAPDSPRMGEIVGGKTADYKSHPYQLQLALNGEQICGAAVIGRWWAVTAAHCLMDEQGDTELLDALVLRSGATYRNTGGRIHSVDKMVVHPRWDPEDNDYDIALLKVRQPFQFGSKVEKIALPSQGHRVQEGQMAVASGWGYLTDEGYDHSDTLQYTMIPIVSQKKCQHSYRKYYTITERMICAGLPSGRKDTCQGDSGGPLAVNGVLIGVVSWGIGCAVPRFPGVYARVPKFRYWIKEITGI